MIHKINQEQAQHIITIEDPIEYTHKSKKSVIVQREVHYDTYSFSAALRSALREDPDVVLIGEMRDLETIASAITIAETGHLVFATLHTNSAAQSIDRMIDVFPPHQQPQIRSQLSNILMAIASQRQVPAIGGPNVTPASDNWLARCVSASPGNPYHVMINDRDAEHVPGCNMAFNRDVLLRLGGFDCKSM